VVSIAFRVLGVIPILDLVPAAMMP